MEVRDEDGNRRARVRLRQLGVRAKRWRWTRRRRGRMPARLWRAATELAGELGAYRVARDLGIGYEALREWLGEAAMVDPRPAQGFVEIATAALFSPPPAAARSEVELSDASGVKVITRFGAGEAVDLPALLAAFRGGR